MSDQKQQYLAPMQQQGQQTSIPSLPTATSMNSNGSSNNNNQIPADSLTCQWTACRERCETPEALYDHVCERHVGRKSTNNLNLTCQWGSCRTTTVKRDHITSHIRVHVPLKPHKCDFCGKSFKRPQDLKKHVKTHADESVLGRSPDPQRMAPNGYQAQMPKTNGYYHAAPSMPQQSSSYGYPTQATPTYNASYYSQPQSAGGPSYGPVSHYSIPQGHQAYAMQTQSRKRPMATELNSFFGDVKRRHINPNQYQDLGSRFGDVSTMNFGGMGGYDGMMDGGGLAYQTAHHPPQFAAPFPELRTKNDLLSLESFLDQLSHTVYDHNEHTMLGPQSLAPITHHPTTYRTSHSPPQMAAPVSYNTSISSASGTPFSNSILSTTDDHTPALTPSSYQASASPTSSANHASPPSRSVASAAAYPSLPAFSTFDQNNANGVMTGTVPVSGIAASYDEHDDRLRRYSGGYLQRAARPDQKSSATSPTSSNDGDRRESTSSELVKGFKRNLLSSPQHQNIKLPGVEEITRTSSSHGSDTESNHEDNGEALEKTRKVIQMLREYIKSRIERQEWEDEGDATPTKHDPMEDVQEVKSENERDSQERIEPSLRYPTLNVEMAV